jgi:predicted glycosyltransferase
VFDLGVPEHSDVLKLPGLRKVANGTYASRRLPLPSREVRAVRSTLLEGAVAAFRPSVMVVDKHPLGIGGELRPALETLRESGGRAALGLRDILDDPATVLEDWAAHDIAAHIVECYDRVLVYGTPSVFNTLGEYRLPPELTRMARYCGYVFRSVEPDTRTIDQPPASERPVVLATAGGGADGFELLATFAAAASEMPWQAVIVSGRQADRAQREDLWRLAREAGAAFRTFVPGLASWFARVEALVCMGGYNTLVEAAAARVPTVCVPRTAPRKEQLIRASAFARLGLLRMIAAERLGPQLLRAEVGAALQTSRSSIAARVQEGLDLRGAHAAAVHLLDLAASAAPMTEPALAVR